MSTTPTPDLTRVVVAVDRAAYSTVEFIRGLSERAAIIPLRGCLSIAIQHESDSEPVKVFSYELNVLADNAHAIALFAKEKAITHTIGGLMLPGEAKPLPACSELRKLGEYNITFACVGLTERAVSLAAFVLSDVSALFYERL